MTSYPRRTVTVRGPEHGPNDCWVQGERVARLAYDSAGRPHEEGRWILTYRAPHIYGAREAAVRYHTRSAALQAVIDRYH